MIGKGNKSFRKLDIQEKSVGTGFVAIKFAHKASGGESTMNLASLTVPTEMTSNGFTNPSASQLLGAKLMFYRNNLKLKSSLRGELTDYLAYVVESNSLIRFLGFTLEQNEIIEGSLGNTPRDGLLVVDGEPLAATGVLSFGATDFNVGTPFEINKFPTQQIGAVKVYREGLLQARCEGNTLAGDGNYIEVPVSGGLGTIIRFKDAGEPSNIIVTSNGSLIERPQDSLMAATERLGGQIDAIVEGLSEITGNDPITYQSAPNNVDLKQFGDIVLGMLNIEIPYMTDWVSFTPVSTWVTNSTHTGKWRRVGDSIEVDFTIALSGAPTATSLVVNLPSGFVIDSSKITGALGTRLVLGNGNASDASPFNNYDLTMFYNTTTTVAVLVQQVGGTYSIGGNVSSTIPVTFASGDSISGTFMVPIVGWNATQTIKDKLGL